MLIFYGLRAIAFIFNYMYMHYKNIKHTWKGIYQFILKELLNIILVYLLLINIIIKVKQKPKHIINNYVQVSVLCYMYM